MPKSKASGVDPADTWERIAASNLANVSDHFEIYCIKSFDFTRVTKILLEREEYGLQGIVALAALYAWTIEPHNDALRRRFMAHVAGEAVARLDQFHSQQSHNRFVGEIQSRIKFPSFFIEIFYPLGGIDRLVRSSSRNSLINSIKRREHGCRIIVALVESFHYHYEELRSDENFRRASVNTSARLTSFFDKSYGVDRTPKKQWRDRAESASLIYAANNTFVKDGRKLLSLIFEDGMALIQKPDVIAGWLGRAKFVQNHILRSVAPSTKGHWGKLDFGDVKEISFSCPPIKSYAKSQIAAEYQKKKSREDDLPSNAG
ncbi:hypothetical protein [Mesorhizobium sp. IMUNJ 23232]|uniref:hypothetical protein n=1 Tax=Mesorhizobium sp. IMUNJ 23232 TaxID=3376064 RepID=UPI0037909E07